MNQDEAARLLAPKREQELARAAERAALRPFLGELLGIEGRDGATTAIFFRGAPGAPLYVDVHGGGFTWGRMDDGGRLCARIRDRIGFSCVCLDYPLVPKAVYPRQLEWLDSVVCNLAGRSRELGFDPSRLVIGGRSAGANLAASLCVSHALRGKRMFACQVLDHPFLDLREGVRGEGCYLGPHALLPETLDLLASGYASGAERSLPTCSPVTASRDVLRNVPPAVIQTCEWDSLRGDGDAYARLLGESGVRVISHCYEGVYHGFTEFENDDMVPGQDWLIDGVAEALDWHWKERGSHDGMSRCG